MQALNADAAAELDPPPELPAGGFDELSSFLLPQAVNASAIAAKPATNADTRARCTDVSPLI
jgi:hypothetical protein